MLRNKIAKTKSSAFQHDVTKVLEHVSGAYETIVNLGETYDSLLENTSNSLLTAPNTRFNLCFSLQQLSWQGGTAEYDFDSLAETGSTMCNNMVSNGTWDSIDHKDTQILALTTKIEEIQKKIAPGSEDPTNGINARAFLSVLYPWRKKNIVPKMIRDDKEWW